MLVPLLLTLPLGIMGLAMPPKETTTPAAAGLEAREAPPKIEVMTMTCLMPGDDDTSSSSSSTDSWPPDSWTSSWSPYWPTTTRSWSWSTSSSSSSSTDDCWYWGDCPSTYYTSTSSAPAAQTCPWWDEDCSSSAASSSSSFGGFGTTMTTSSSTSDWWPDPWTTVTDSWDTTFATATSKPSSASHRHYSAPSSSTFEESDAPSIVPLPTSLRHQPIPPMIEPLSPRKRAPPAPSTPPTAPASGFFFGLFRSPFGSDSSNINNRVKGVSAVEKISTETIVIGVSTDGTPIYTSTEWGSDSSSSSSSGSGSSSSFWAAGGPSSSSSSTTTTTTTSQPDVITPAPQSVTVSSSSTLRCDDEFCSDGSSWCVYWAGITSWDASKGPVPGEKATTIGTC